VGGHYYKNYLGGVFVVNLKNQPPKASGVKIKYVTVICEYKMDFSEPRYDYERDEAICDFPGEKVNLKN
jgi:hypothetical protein